MKTDCTYEMGFLITIPMNVLPNVLVHLIIEFLDIRSGSVWGCVSTWYHQEWKQLWYHKGPVHFGSHWRPEMKRYFCDCNICDDERGVFYPWQYHVSLYDSFRLVCQTYAHIEHDQHMLSIP